MSASTFKIFKTCEHCGKLFEAQKTTTRYCCHKCNSSHYKLKIKLSKKRAAEKETFRLDIFRPKVKAINLEMIKQKEFLSVREVATLFNCAPKTVYALINSKRLKAVNLGMKKTTIKRSEIDKLFK